MLVPLASGCGSGFACRDTERNPAAAAMSGVAVALANAADGAWCLFFFVFPSLR